MEREPENLWLALAEVTLDGWPLPRQLKACRIPTERSQQSCLNQATKHLDRIDRIVQDESKRATYHH